MGAPKTFGSTVSISLFLDPSRLQPISLCCLSTLSLYSLWWLQLPLCLVGCLTSSLSLSDSSQNGGAGRTRIPHQCSAPCRLGLDHACVQVRIQSAHLYFTPSVPVFSEDFAWIRDDRLKALHSYTPSPPPHTPTYPHTPKHPHTHTHMLTHTHSVMVWRSGWRSLSPSLMRGCSLTPSQERSSCHHQKERKCECL